MDCFLYGWYKLEMNQTHLFMELSMVVWLSCIYLSRVEFKIHDSFMCFNCVILRC